MAKASASSATAHVHGCVNKVLRVHTRWHQPARVLPVIEARIRPQLARLRHHHVVMAASNRSHLGPLKHRLLRPHQASAPALLVSPRPSWRIPRPSLKRSVHSHGHGVGAPRRRLPSRSCCPLKPLPPRRHQPVLRFKVFETAVTGSLMQQAQNMLPDLMKQQKALGMVDFASECP